MITEYFTTEIGIHPNDIKNRPLGVWSIYEAIIETRWGHKLQSPK